MHRIEGANFTLNASNKNAFTEGPPGTTITAEWLNAIQEEICTVIENSGLAVKTEATDTTYTQLWDALQILGRPYDYIVSSQATFNAIIERVGANQYKIADNYKSIFVKQIAGGYACSGSSSFLSGGDTWGYIETNNCSNIEFEKGAYLNFSTAVGYLEINNDNSYLKCVDIRGDKSSASAITQSFYLNADFCTFINCSSSLRLSNTSCYVFNANDAKDLYTSKLINCTVDDFDSSGYIAGFRKFENLTGCIVNDIESTNNACEGFIACLRLSECVAKYVTVSGGATHAVGFGLCTNLSSCRSNNINNTVGDSYGFRNSTTITSCLSATIDSSGGASVGFYTCNDISASLAQAIYSSSDEAYGFLLCSQISASHAYIIDHTGSVAGKAATGFSTCTQVSACKASDIDVTGTGTAYGFNTCDQISACFATDIESSAGNAIGFYACDQLSACKSTSITASGTASGFNGCTFGSSLWTDEPVNGANDYIDTTDAAITNKFSSHPTNWT